MLASEFMFGSRNTENTETSTASTTKIRLQRSSPVFCELDFSSPGGCKIEMQNLPLGKTFGCHIFERNLKQGGEFGESGGNVISALKCILQKDCRLDP